MRTPRLLYLVTEDWYFMSHRLPMARAARDAGFEVHVATRVGSHAAAIEAEGFRLHPLTWRRGSTNPLAVLMSILAVRTLYRGIRPDIAHHVALQPSIVGAFAASGLPISVINAVAGMGFAFTADNLRARLTRFVMKVLMRSLFNRRRSTALVQNPDDQSALVALGISPERIVRIAGSGVDTDRLTPLPEPPPPVTVGYAGRLLEDKGLRTLLKAQALLAERGRSVRLLLAGEPDPANPASIAPAVLNQWQRQPGVEFLGHVSDIRSLWKQAHIAVLPSRREGLPLSLMEAAACGRPLIATDVPGCREIAQADVNAILVPVDDVEAIAAAITRLADDSRLRARYGVAGRDLVERQFSADRIGQQIVELYSTLIARQREAIARTPELHSRAPTP